MMVKVSCGHGCLGKVFQGPTTIRMATTTRATKKTDHVFFSSPVRDKEAASLVVSDTYGLKTSTPWLMLPPEIDPTTGEKVDCFYSPINKHVHKLNRKKVLGVPEEAWCFTSSRGWLGFIDPNDCSLYLSVPLRDSPAKVLYGNFVQLPSIESLPSVLGVKRIPSSSTSVDEFMILDPYNNHNHNDDSMNHHCRYINPKSLSRFIVKHLSLSLDSYWGAEDQEACVALAIQGELPQLAYCRVGRDEAWTPMIGSTVSFPQTGFTIERPRGFEEVNHKLFYTMYTDVIGHGIDAWDICKPWRMHRRDETFMYQEHSRHLHEKFRFKTCERNLRNQCESKRYLVGGNSPSGILLIIRHIAPHVAEDGSIIVDEDSSHEHLKARRYKTLRFDVYNVDMKKRKLNRLKSIGNRVIFLGLNQSFVLSAQKLPGLRANSIYFTDDYIDGKAISYTGEDMGIYNLEDNSIEPCYPFADYLKKDEKIMQPLIWVAPNSSPNLWM